MVATVCLRDSGNDLVHLHISWSRPDDQLQPVQSATGKARIVRGERMLPDFEMIQHQFLGGHDITIIPLADVHLGSAECMEQEFIKFIDTVKETPNTYLAVLGDLLDNGIKSSVSNTYKQVMSPSQATQTCGRPYHRYTPWQP